MLDNRKLLITVTVLAIVGVLSLLAYSATLGDTELDIAEIQRSHEGCVLVTSGTVTDARTLPGGSISMTLSDMNTSASVGVYISPEVAKLIANNTLIPGGKLSVRGVLSFYLESPEIAVSRAGDIIILAESGNSEYDMATLMGAIALFDGLETTTSGNMADMEVIMSSGNLVGTSFQLWDTVDNQTYSLECMCFDRDLSAMHSDGDMVIVTGMISYYENRGCWQMMVEIISPID